MRTIDPALEENPALWNEVWSSLRYDDELRPLVQERYRAWSRSHRAAARGGSRGRLGSGSPSIPKEPGWRLAAAADGIDSILYLGLLDRDDARVLLASCVIRELER